MWTECWQCSSNPSICGTGSCTNDVGTYLCDCSLTGYAGTNCETELPACSVNQNVENFECTDCVGETTNDASDKPSAGSSECSVSPPPDNEFGNATTSVLVVSTRCVETSQTVEEMTTAENHEVACAALGAALGGTESFACTETATADCIIQPVADGLDAEIIV